MTFASSRRRKHHIALAMLAVWVFALLSGVANACLTEPHGEPAHTGLHSSRPDHPAQTPQHALTAPALTQAQHTVDHHHPDQHPDKAPCQKSCDESSQTLLKQMPKLDTPDLQPTLISSRPCPGLALQAPNVTGGTLVAGIPPPSPPLRLQFSRLAL